VVLPRLAHKVRFVLSSTYTLTTVVSRMLICQKQNRILDLCDVRVRILLATTRTFAKTRSVYPQGVTRDFGATEPCRRTLSGQTARRSVNMKQPEVGFEVLSMYKKGMHQLQRRRREACQLRYSSIWIGCVQRTSCLQLYQDRTQRRCPLYKSDLVIRHECNKTFG
jgi:hypothetical protein